MHRPHRGGLDRAGAPSARAASRPRDGRRARPCDVHLRRRGRHPGRTHRVRRALRDTRAGRDPAPRGWNDRGGDADDGRGATTLIVGACPVRGEISRRLLDALPVVLRVDTGGTAPYWTTRRRGRRRHAGPAGGTRPAAGLDAGLHAARVV
ncbi:cupin domain-containing protein [Streptomyces sp. NPDC020845]|uniref:cupin domain-containing protein n=1 Tax=Streptomyces sp. NPDC020845 TaxID=3365096 RepID=UPI00379300B2